MSEKTDEAIELLEAGIRGLTTSETWSKFLLSASKFHAYSFNNQMLIAMQNPYATRVAGYNAWKEQGRQVRKGERSLRILAPMAVKDDEAPSGKKIIGFRTVGVFDISQTDGPELPESEIVRNLAGDGPTGALAALESFAESIGYGVHFEAMESEVNGFCRYADKYIAVKSSNDGAMQVKTLAHELTHALLHEGYTDRPLAEFEAESAAFIICNVLGIDSSEYSFGYVTVWQGGADNALAALKASGKRISDTAKQVLGKVLGKVEALAAA